VVNRNERRKEVTNTVKEREREEREREEEKGR
jgi:hypothetical protein